MKTARKSSNSLKKLQSSYKMEYFAKQKKKKKWDFL